MSGRGRIALALFAALGIAVLALWWTTAFERVDRWQTLPPRGEPSYNPLYELKRALQADGVPVVARQRLDLDATALAPRDTVLILSDPRAVTAADARRLLTWVGAGGHLVMRVPPYDFSEGAQELRGPLLEPLPLYSRLQMPECSALKSPDGKPHPEFCGGARFDPTPEARLLARLGNDEDGYVFARIAHGDGSIDVLAEPDFLTNRQLDEPTHAALARQLLAPNYREGTVHLVYAATMPPLWRFLLDRAWMALLPLLLALLGWLWMRMQRFGPWLPSPPQARRSLVEHVQATGEHLYRYGRSVRLQTALRDDVLMRLRRRDALAAALDGPAQADAIASRTGLSNAEVAATLDTRASSDAADFRLRIARLIALRKRL